MWGTTRKPPKKLSKQAEINIACDMMASDTTAARIDGGGILDDPVLRLPYPGSKAMLKIGRRWIMSRFKREIYKASRMKEVKKYCSDKYEWDEYIFNLVNWDSVGSVRRQMLGTKLMQTSKIMHGWLPIMHKRYHITGSKQCPECPCLDKTMRHLNQCPNKQMVKTRKEALARIKKVAKKGKIPQAVITAFCHVIETECNSGKENDFYLRTFTPILNTAVEDQIQIGTDLMLLGYLAKSWAEAMRECGVKENLDHRMNKLQRIIWNE